MIPLFYHSMVEENRSNRQSIGKSVAKVVNDVFGQGTEVHVHWNLANADNEHSGVFASAFVHTASITRNERGALEEAGLHLVEQAAHITENPDMDDTIVEVPLEKLSDAAETDMELILELEQSFVDDSV